jgi:serine/threonine protein kinase
VSQDHSQTDGPTSITLRYCAPEVYSQELRGRSADIFSLDCVFLETLTVYDRKDLQEFADFRSSESGDQSFHANLEKVQAWTRGISMSTWEAPRETTSDPKYDHRKRMYNTAETVKLSMIPPDVMYFVTDMLKREPRAKPTAKRMLDYLASLKWTSSFRSGQCCILPPESYEVCSEPHFALVQPEGSKHRGVSVFENSHQEATGQYTQDATHYSVYSAQYIRYHINSCTACTAYLRKMRRRPPVPCTIAVAATTTVYEEEDAL